MTEPNGDRAKYERQRDRTLVAIGATGLVLLGFAGVFVKEVGSSPLLLMLVTAFLAMVLGPGVLPKRNGR